MLGRAGVGAINGKVYQASLGSPVQTADTIAICWVGIHVRAGQENQKAILLIISRNAAVSGKTIVYE